MSRTLYILGPDVVEKERRAAVYHAVADDGEVLAAHFCSGREYALNDLYERRLGMREKCRTKFGTELYKVIELYGTADDPEILKILKLNEEFYKSWWEK